jgi:hypothetical protein
MSTLSTKTTNISGVRFLELTKDKTIQDRDRIATNLAIKGNFPSYLRRFVPIKVEQGGNILIYKVMPNFLEIGNSEDDAVIWPFTGPSAQKIADTFDCILPTAKMSKQIWKQAKIKLPAKPLSGMISTIDNTTYSPEQFIQSKHMTSNNGIAFHNKVIHRQLQNMNYQPGDLIAGSKKDVVVSNDLLGKNRLGLHGLYNSIGEPIQKGSLTVHDLNHLEYSQGIRLIDRQAILNGKNVDLLTDVLQSKEYAYLVNDSPKPLQFSYQYGSAKQKSSVSDTELKAIPAQTISGPPKGYAAFRAGEEVPPDVKQMAKIIMHKFIDQPFGTSIPFSSNGKDYIARVERHSNAPRGITVYKKKDAYKLTTEQQTVSLPSAIKQQTTEDESKFAPIYRYFDEASKAISNLF